MRRILRRDVEQVEKRIREHFYTRMTGDPKPAGGNVWVNAVETKEWEARVLAWTRENRPDAIEADLWGQTKGAYWPLRRVVETAGGWSKDFADRLNRYCGVETAQQAVTA